jgi:hypothetical protein
MSASNSIPTTKTVTRRRKNKKEAPPSQLAADSFAAFEPYLNIFDPGARGLVDPVHSITKESWALNARRKAGEKILIHASGREFNPYNDIVRNIYSPQHVHDHIENGEISYFTSGRNSLGLLYLDIDAHKTWQTDEYRAKDVLQKLFPSGYYRASGRGQNGYLKIRYSSIAEFNHVAAELQASLNRMFLHLGILCDIEVKGTITKKKSGSLGKLPFTTKNPCQMRDETDSWNYRQLELFKACPIINARRVGEIIREIEPLIDENEVARFAEHKKRLDREHAEDGDDLTFAPFLLEPEIEGQPDLKVIPEAEVPSKQQLGASPRQSTRVRVGSTDMDVDLANAFERNHKDLRELARGFFRQKRRLPDIDEALDWLKANGRYSGAWEDNEAHRAKRVGQILGHIEKSFDPKQLSHPNAVPVNLTLGTFAWWVSQKFGSGIASAKVAFDRFDPVKMTAPIERHFVPAHFIETFITVADFCLNHDPLENKAVPTNRFKKLWSLVEDGAPWNQEYFQIVRDRLDDMGVVDVFDRQHEPNKAWRWNSGPEFPAETWKESQRTMTEEYKVLAERVPSNEEAVDFSLWEKYLHNTLYHFAEEHHRFLSEKFVVRPPPN